MNIDVLFLMSIKMIKNVSVDQLLAVSYIFIHFVMTYFNRIIQ